MSTNTQTALPSMFLRQPPSLFRFEKTKDGWTIVEDIFLEGEPTLILDEFLRDIESFVIGHKMIERAKEGVEEKGACAGRFHAERMLEQQKNIPTEWQSFHLLFPGTIWSDLNGCYWVVCLYYDPGIDLGQWHPRWSILISGFTSMYRLVRISK